MSAKLTAIIIFAFVSLAAAAALLLAGVFGTRDEANKTFAGARFIQSIPRSPGGIGENEREEGHGRIPEHTLGVPGGDAGRARGQGNAL